MADFNLTAWVYHGRTFSSGGLDWVAGKPAGAPDLVADAALTHYRFVGLGPRIYAQKLYLNPNYFAAYDTRQLLFNARTDLRPCIDVSPDNTDIIVAYDVVRLPADRQQWYYVYDVVDVGRGHANEFRVAMVIPWFPWWTFPIN